MIPSHIYSEMRKTIVSLHTSFDVKISDTSHAVFGPNSFTLYDTSLGKEKHIDNWLAYSLDELNDLLSKMEWI